MNAYLLWSPSAGRAALIDPGDDPDLLISEIEKTGCELSCLLCTHGHFDHISAAAEIQSRWPLPLLAHIDDRATIGRLSDSRAMFGFPPVPQPEVSYFSGPRHELPFADGVLDLIHAPGHCPGHVLVDLDAVMIVGDVIFQESIGRTDLPGGDSRVLEATIRQRIYTRKEGTVLHCGHGPSTTVGHEKRFNPFVRAL